MRFGREIFDLARQVVDIAGGRFRLFLAESCTGGLISSAITAVPGSSSLLWGSAVVYSNYAKEMLCGVPGDLLKARGAVSRDCVESLITGSLDRYPVDIVCAVSGIAGPGGGSADKPVGLVYLGCGTRETGISGIHIEEHRFAGGRDDVRFAAAQRVLRLLIGICRQR